MHGRTQGKKIRTRFQRVQDYHQKQMSSSLWSLLANEGLEGGLLAACPLLPLVVDLHANSDVKGEPPLKLFSTPNLKYLEKKLPNI